MCSRNQSVRWFRSSLLAGSVPVPLGSHGARPRVAGATTSTDRADTPWRPAHSACLLTRWKPSARRHSGRSARRRRRRLTDQVYCTTSVARVGNAAPRRHVADRPGTRARDAPGDRGTREPPRRRIAELWPTGTWPPRSPRSRRPARQTHPPTADIAFAGSRTRTRRPAVAKRVARACARVRRSGRGHGGRRSRGGRARPGHSPRSAYPRVRRRGRRGWRPVRARARRPRPTTRAPAPPRAASR